MFVPVVDSRVDGRCNVSQSLEHLNFTLDKFGSHSRRDDIFPSGAKGTAKLSVHGLFHVGLHSMKRIHWSNTVRFRENGTRVLLSSYWWRSVNVRLYLVGYSVVCGIVDRGSC